MDKRKAELYIVTGGASVIGGCMVRTLNKMDISDSVIVDNIASTDKWMHVYEVCYDFLVELPAYERA